MDWAQWVSGAYGEVLSVELVLALSWPPQVTSNQTTTARHSRATCGKMKSEFQSRATCCLSRKHHHSCRVPRPQFTKTHITEAAPGRHCPHALRNGLQAYPCILIGNSLGHLSYLGAA